MKSAPDRRQGVVYIASRLVAEAGTMFSPGAVAVVDGNVLLAGPKADVLRAAPAGFPRMEFPGSVIVPGLVNAHAHLQIPRFTDDAGKPMPIPPSFVDWILRVIAWRLGCAPGLPCRKFQVGGRRGALLRHHGGGGDRRAGPSLVRKLSPAGAGLRGRDRFRPERRLRGPRPRRRDDRPAGEDLRRKPPCPGGSLPPHAVHRRGGPPPLPRGTRRRKEASRLPPPRRIDAGDDVPFRWERGDRVAPVPCRRQGRLLVSWSRADDPFVPLGDRFFAGRGAAGA